MSEQDWKVDLERLRAHAAQVLNLDGVVWVYRRDLEALLAVVDAAWEVRSGLEDDEVPPEFDAALEPFPPPPDRAWEDEAG